MSGSTKSVRRMYSFRVDEDVVEALGRLEAAQVARGVLSAKARSTAIRKAILEADARLPGSARLPTPMQNEMAAHSVTQEALKLCQRERDEAKAMAAIADENTHAGTRVMGYVKTRHLADSAGLPSCGQRSYGESKGHFTTADPKKVTCGRRGCDGTASGDKQAMRAELTLLRKLRDDLAALEIGGDDPGKERTRLCVLKTRALEARVEYKALHGAER